MSRNLSLTAAFSDPIFETFRADNEFALFLGFTTNVAMSFKRIQRNTETLGKCKRVLNFKWYPNLTEYTSTDLYIMNCLTTIVVDKCNCFPYFSPPQAKNVKHLDSAICGDSVERAADGICMTNAMNTEYFIERTCYNKIPIPCREFRVNSKSQSKVYPSTHTLSRLKQEFNAPGNMSLDEFRLNYVSANFYVKDRKWVMIVENPAMTWVDLLNKAGGTLGMCLGMSLISIVEILIVILYEGFFWSKGYHSKRKMSLIQPKVGYCP